MYFVKHVINVLPGLHHVELYTVTTSLLLRHAEPTIFFKHYCTSRVGIPRCETTPVKAYTRTKPVAFKF